MTPEVPQLFVDVPDDEPRRSRLEPYREQILLWRRQGRTYRRIQNLLAEKCSILVSLAMVHKFVRSHNRPRKVQPEVQTEPIAATPVVETAAPLEQPARPRLLLEERIAQRDAIRAAHNKPAIQREDPRPVFTFDPSKPITNKNYEQQGRNSGNSNAGD